MVSIDSPGIRIVLDTQIDIDMILDLTQRIEQKILPREKIRLLEEIERALRDMLVLCYAKRNATKQKRQKIIDICSKWDLDVKDYLDDTY